MYYLCIRKRNKQQLEPAATDKRQNKMETYNIIEVNKTTGEERVMFTATGCCTGGITVALEAMIAAYPENEYYADQIS
jgi:hypothetical protein